MDIQWKAVESTVQPAEVDTQMSANGVYLRKDIIQQTRTVNGVTTTPWLYQEAFLTNQEYIQYIDEISNTTEYIAKQKAKQKAVIALEYKGYFNELDNICAAKFARGLCTTEQINTQRTALQTELTQKLSEV